MGTLHAALFPIALALTTATSCSASETQAAAAPGFSTNGQDPSSKNGNDMPTKSAQEAALEFTALQIKTIERKQPQSVEEAKEVLNKIRSLFDHSNLPKALRNPVSRESARSFAESMRFLHLQREVDLVFLENLDIADVPYVDRFTAQRLTSSRDSSISRLTKYFPREYKHTLDDTRMQIGGLVDGKMSMVTMAAEADMGDANRVRNLFSNELLNTSREAAILVALGNADIMVMLDALMETPSEWEEKRAQVKATIAAYRKNMSAAIDVFMPPADIQDDELAKIAMDVLARKDYGLPSHVRLIVNAPKRKESSEEYFLDWDAETITKTKREWEEFQVATIEKHGEGYEIWFNTLMYYHTGPTTVIKGKWLLGPRHMSSPIAEKNIQK